jgi:predicted ATPase/DNA-binding CsgD family transcriptional regulator
MIYTSTDWFPNICYTVWEPLYMNHLSMNMSTHEQTIPVVQEDILLYRENGQDERLPVGTPAWYAWLHTARTFSFRGASGTFTARKEQASNKRGGWYWRAYRKRSGKLHRVYLGKAEEITLERLRAVAAALAGQNAVERDERVPDRHILPEQLEPANNQKRFPHPATEPSLPPVRRSSHLPLPLTSLLGREREVAAVCTLLARLEVRFLTLTGTGGVGKTRLALAIASEVEGGFPDGVCFVSLASIQDAASVLPTLVQTLGLQSSRAPLKLLQTALREQQLLLVLDNFEQVAEAAPLLIDLLAACSWLKLLVTSREVLHVRGEHVVEVPPLALPDPRHLSDSATLARYGAVALFLERAREVQPPLEFTPGNAALIAEICVRLDGLPLALELAAARLKLLPLPALLERLGHRLALLTGGPRDLPARQHTMRDTIAWSYDLLSQEEQRLFRLFSIFVGGGTLPAMEAMYAALGGESAQVLDGVASLLDKHLLHQAGQGERRLLMLETIREFGLEALAKSQEMEAVRQVHTAYYLRLAEEAETHLFGAEQVRWFDLLEQEYANLCAALSWVVEQAERALRLVGALVRYWAGSRSLSGGLSWLERVLAATSSVSTPLRIRALGGAAWLAFLLSDVERAEMLCQECLHLYRAARQTREAQDLAAAVLWLGWLPLTHGNDDEVRYLLEEGRALARDKGDTKNLASLLNFLGIATIGQQNYAQARSLLEESLRYYRELENQQDLVWSFLHLGQVCFALGEAARAGALVEEGLAQARATHSQTGVAHALYLSGRLALAQNDVTRASACFEESLSIFEDLHFRLPSNSAQVLSWLAGIALLQDVKAKAVPLCERSIALFRQMDDREGIALSLQQWGCLVAHRGAAIWAAQLWGAAEALGGATRSWRPFDLLILLIALGEHTDYEQMMAAVRAELGEQVFAAAWAGGRTMSPEQAIAEHEHLPVPGRAETKTWANQHEGLAPAYPNDLTEREMEVLRLVARGLTDAQVAESLVISPRTVNAHLRSIYSKLNITSRHAATLFALEQHLI